MRRFNSYDTWRTLKIHFIRGFRLPKNYTAACSISWMTPEQEELKSSLANDLLPQASARNAAAAAWYSV